MDDRILNYRTCSKIQSSLILCLIIISMFIAVSCFTRLSPFISRPFLHKTTYVSEFQSTSHCLSAFFWSKSASIVLAHAAFFWKGQICFSPPSVYPERASLQSTSMIDDIPWPGTDRWSMMCRMQSHCASLVIWPKRKGSTFFSSRLWSRALGAALLQRLTKTVVLLDLDWTNVKFEIRDGWTIQTFV